MRRRRSSRFNPQAPIGSVTAAVIVKEGKILIARRKKGERFAGLWEFPGGKLEADEQPKEGLQRELREELGVEAEVGDFVGAVPFETDECCLRLLAFRTRLKSCDFCCQNHDQILWVKPSELASYEFMEPDRRVIEIAFPGRNAISKTKRESS